MSTDTRFYDRFSALYDLLSPKSYYRDAREAAIKALSIKTGDNILSLACGTGQNFEIFERYLGKSGLIIGIDLSRGMLSKANAKIKKNHWQNIQLINADAGTIDIAHINRSLPPGKQIHLFDSAICELGLTAMPCWQAVIDNMLKLIKPGGRIVIMDWYMEKPNLRGKLINHIGKADISRPIWAYLQQRVTEFSIDSHFNRGGVFVAYGKLSSVAAQQKTGFDNSVPNNITA